MKLKLIFYTGIFLLVSIFGMAQSNDRKKGNADQTPVVTYPEGVLYALPRTVIVVRVSAKREVFVPGPYAAYAKKYLGYNQVEFQGSTKWNINGIDIELTGDPDPSAMFKALDSVASKVTLMADGRIYGINIPMFPEEYKINKQEFVVSESVPKVVFPDLSSSDEYDVVVDPNTGGEKMIVKSFETKAQEAADYLIHLRKKRILIQVSSSDMMPGDGAAYVALLEESKRLEKDYTELFLGKTFSSEHQFLFEYIPGDKETKNEILFRFSEEKGILPVSDVTGRPVVIDLVKNNNSFARVQELKASQNPQAGKSGVFYRIPVMGDLSISNGLNPLFLARIPIAQFGVIAPLPENLIDGRKSITFDPVTGNVRQILGK